MIVDSNNVIPPNTVTGYDPKADRERYYFDENSGIVVIPMPPLKLRKDLELPKSMNVEIP